MTSTLGCYFPGEEPCFVAIHINSNAYVDDLIDAIHEGLQKRGRVVERKTLYLYKTDIETRPLDDLPTRSRQWVHEQPDQARLDPSLRLPSIFPEGIHESDERLHILVADPIVAEFAETPDSTDVPYNRKIEKERANRISGLPPSQSPSEIVTSGKNTANFLGSPRPRAFLNQVPVAIFSPPLANLQQNLQSLENVPITHADLIQGTEFTMNSIKAHDNVKDRLKLIKDDIDGLVGQPGEWDKHIPWAMGIKPGAIWWFNDFAAIIMEVKNYVGIDGDARLQATADYATIVPCSKFIPFQRKTNFPIILVGISGSRLEISCAVCIDSIYRSDLYTLDISGGFQCAETILKVTRAFKALSMCYSELKTYYAGVTAFMGIKYSSMFPNPTSASGETLPLLTYRRFMNRAGQPTSTLPDLGNMVSMMYIATLHDTNLGTDREVVVKFTARYNKDAHELLANAKFAPKLHFCGRVVGGLYMVVMDHVKGKSVWQLQADGTNIPSIVPTQVKEAVSRLHEKGFVFGDLRDSNILYDQSDDSVLLVDFDWAGKDGEGRYPTTLNKTNDWEASVHPGALMRKVHDIYQVDRIATLCT